MATLVLAIETLGNDWNSFSELVKQSLIKKQLKENDSTAAQIKITEHKQQLIDKLSLSPLTGQIISLAMYDVERNLGAVYFVSDDSNETFITDSFTFKSRTEREILEDFWEGAGAYDTFVTFNGRAFTLPFLYHRSAIQKIKPTVEIARERSVVRQAFPSHVDLLDEFTFSGAMQSRPALSVLAGAYGVDYQPTVWGARGGFFLGAKNTPPPRHSKRHYRHHSHPTLQNLARIFSATSVYKY
ncbi:MAG: hypothetical protein RLZZ230_123 [Candidatus Parcubacteria bacterium]|jgi:DNA polymerase elongation subunit (family B)